MRTTATALIFMAMAASASANDDVQNVALRVQNLTRADGKQTALLTGRTLPAPAARAITVTLRVGAATATLTGKVSRSGRLRATGRKLALATPLASFDHIDVDVTGGFTTALLMASDDCLRAPTGRRLDCVETPPAPGGLSDGAYDLTLTISGQPPAGTTDSARLINNPSGTRSLLLHVSALDSAMLQMETDGSLAGYYVMGGDAYSSVTGSASDVSTPALARLNGSFSQNFGGGGGYVFTMERVPAGTSSAFGGTWKLTFTGGGLLPFSGTATLGLIVPANGDTTAAPTTLVRTGGTIAYTTNTSTCDVAPAGGMYCSLSIGTPPATGFVFLHGMLDADGGSGQGTFAIGSAPFIQSTGNWTATR